MIKLFTSLIIIFAIQSTKCQTPPIVKSIKTQSFKNTSKLQENDSEGNVLFRKNNGMNGPITIISVFEYDSLNRKVRSFLAHSNIGYSVSEVLYKKNKRESYKYTNPDVSGSINRNILNNINTKEEFKALKDIQNLIRGEKRLAWIETLDSNENRTQIKFLDEKGETTTIQSYRYNENNQKIYFRYNTPKSKLWNWEIFSLYDINSNLVKSFRVTPNGEYQDTSEIYNYYYNSKNLKVLKTLHNNNKFERKIEYQYNNKSQIVKEKFYEDDESIPKIITTYKYDKWGNVVKEIRKRLQYSGKNLKEITKIKYEYW